VKPLSRRERMPGFRYSPRGCGPLKAEVRKGCRDELKILYSGVQFGDAVIERLRTLGDVSILETSRVNPKMKDLFRLKSGDLRVEGARDGELVVAFFGPTRRGGGWRKRLEKLLAPS